MQNSESRPLPVDGQHVSNQGIDWGRLAETQDDGYDTQSIKVLAKERYGWEKQYPTHDAATWLEGTVTLRPTSDDGDGVEHHPNIVAAEALLREFWPAMYRQCQELLQTVVPVLAPNTAVAPLQSGCTCGPVGDRVSFEIMTTINGGVGMIEGVVHEFAHNKLKALGISLEHWERLITNPQPTREEIDTGTGDFVYESPVRKDKLRPLGACISAHYSYVYVSEWLVRLVQSDAVDPEHFAGWLKTMGRRLEEGESVVYEIAELDEPGTQFFGALHDWADRLITEVDQLTS